MSKIWTCPRQAVGVRCGHKNPRRIKNCQKCGKRRPERIGKRPDHLQALNQPYDYYRDLDGGVDQCGICGTTGKSRRLHRDHDHATGQPRGILCFRCNTALPNRVTVDWLRAAADYLERAQQRA